MCAERGGENVKRRKREIARQTYTIYQESLSDALFLRNSPSISLCECDVRRCCRWGIRVLRNSSRLPPPSSSLFAHKETTSVSVQVPYLADLNLDLVDWDVDWWLNFSGPGFLGPQIPPWSSATKSSLPTVVGSVVFLLANFRILSSWKIWFRHVKGDSYEKMAF